MDLTKAEQRLKAVQKKRMRLSEFVDQCRKLIPLFAGKQVRYQVSDFPDERTIRYYAQEGLIDRPTRQGRNVVFSYRHLLQIIALKRLQAEYLPLRKIAEITREFDNQRLEALLNGVETHSQTLLPALLEAPSSDAQYAVSFRTASAPDEAWDWTPPDLSAWATSDAGWSSWRKFKIHDHLELHVDERFSALDPTVDIEKIVARLMNVVSMLSAQSSDRAIPDRDLSDLFDRQDSFYVSAAPVKALGNAVVALITEGGLVPKGNPDRLESAKATHYFKYRIADATSMEEDAFESVDRGLGHHLRERGPEPAFASGCHAGVRTQENNRQDARIFLYHHRGRNHRRHGQVDRERHRFRTEAAGGFSRHTHRHLRHRHSLRSSDQQGNRTRRDPHRPYHHPCADRAYDRRVQNCSRPRNYTPGRQSFTSS